LPPSDNLIAVSNNNNNNNNNTFNSRHHYSYHKIVLPYLPGVTKAEKNLKTVLVFDKQKAEGEYKKYRRL